MPYALINTSGDKDYHKAVVEWLETIDEMKVRGVVLVAVCDEGPCVSWDCTPMDMAAAASFVQAQSVLNYMNGVDEDEDSD